MADLHLCTCGYTDETASFDADRTIGGCAAVPYRDVCRFEQALADPTQAQVTAGREALELALGWRGQPLDAHPVPAEKTAQRDAVVRAVLAAAAVVVLGRPPCTSCGRPLGTGTLLDFAPEPPTTGPYSSGAMQEWEAIVPPRGPAGIARGLWAEFAARYRCPYCAEEDVPVVLDGEA